MKKMFRTIALSAVGTVTMACTAFAGTWQKNNNEWRYLNDAGQMVVNQLINDNNQLYYLGADGAMKTGFVPINGAYYYFSPAGNMQIGWVYDNNAWYYMSRVGDNYGQMLVNKSKNVDGKYYYFGADGKMVHDTTVNGQYYGSDGEAVIERYSNDDGSTYYYVGETKVTELSSGSIDWVDFYLNEPRPTADQLDGLGYTTPEQKALYWEDWDSAVRNAQSFRDLGC